MSAAFKDAARKLLELSLTHVATFAFPLCFAVVGGRVLGLHNYGVVAFYTALAAFLGVVIEFGFDWLGIREVASAPDDPAHRQRVLVDVTAAKIGLCAVVSSIASALVLWMNGPSHIGLMLATVAHMVGFALDTSWYLRAIERTRPLLAITVAVRCAGVALLLWVVSLPGDMAPALWTYAFVALANAALGWAVLVRLGQVPRAWPEPRRIAGLLRRAVAIVFGNLNGALLTNGGVALLGLTAEPAVVGAANLALRLKMAGQAVLLPINQLCFVRLSALASSDPQQAVRVGRIALAVLLTGGSIVGLAIVLLAPWIVRQVFLQEQPVAIGLAMLLGLSVAINAAGNLLGMQSLIAFGRERSYAAAVAFAAVVFCVLLFGLRGELAYGWALVAAELAMALAAGLRLTWVVRAVRAA